MFFWDGAVTVPHAKNQSTTPITMKLMHELNNNAEFLCKEYGIHERTFLMVWNGKTPIEIQSRSHDVLNLKRGWLKSVFFPRFWKPRAKSAEKPFGISVFGQSSQAPGFEADYAQGKLFPLWLSFVIWVKWIGYFPSYYTKWNGVFPYLGETQVEHIRV